MTFQIILEPELAAQYKARGHWTGKTFFEILEERASEHPGREVFSDATGRITYGELKDRMPMPRRYSEQRSIRSFSSP